ncbi:hypothetical protein ACFFGH_34325 [Lysobacter korlensis]|uniref:Uncharacterized protein n=1 Tax=Lysobacter korlensis TaxID=553636 RepID=A0ABV6S475_9GAMM
MQIKPNPCARLLVELPTERYTVLSAAGRAPRIGDLVALDLGFTAPDGRAMVLAYFPAVGPETLYEAEVYETELE